MNVSIIGSCQSRDIFNSNFIENYKEYFNVLSYYPMTSMLSVMSSPVQYNYQNLIKSGMNDLQLEHWYFEFEKPILKTLESKKPDYLLLDFYADARYGACSYGSEYVVNRLYRLKDKNIINWNKLGIVYSYEKNAKDFFVMWKNAFDRFMAFVEEKLPETKVIINTIKGTNVITDKEGRRYLAPKIAELDVDKINTIWQMMDSYAIEKHHVEAITYEKEYTLDPEYLFGLGVALVHFHPDYYNDYFQKLLEITDTEKKEVQQQSHINLLDKRAFEFGADRCYHVVGRFREVEYKGYKAIRPIDCRKQLGQYRPQIWSKPIEIKGDGNTPYTLSFYIKINDLSKIREDMVVFGIRTFKHIKSLKEAESIESFSLNLKGHVIKEKEDYRYVFTFYPKGKYIKVAPFLFRYIPGIEYSRIKLECSDTVSKY